MNDTQPWYTSKTIWGGLIAVGAAVAGFFGYTVSAADQAQIVEGVAAAGALVGGLMAIVGRVKASKTIGS